MRLAFIGIDPSKELVQVLVAGGIEVSVKKLSSPLPLLPSPDVIVAACSPPKFQSRLEKIRTSHLEAWICAVVDRRDLKDTVFQSELLSCSHKDDVWIQPGWELTFWFSLQRAVNHQKAIRELAHAKTEIAQLKTNCSELFQSSSRLIAQLEKDVTLANNIQKTLLPRVSPEIPGISVAVKYIPAAGLGGDYYDLFEFGDRKRFGVLIADSQTHGMAALLLSVLLKVRLEEVKDRFPDSQSFMEFINREIQALYQKDFSSLSLLYGILDRSSLTFRYTVAGNLAPFLWRAGKAASLECAAAPPLGTLTHFDFRENEIILKPGDNLILHTDGLDAPLTQEHPTAFERLAYLLEKRQHANDPLEIQNELMALVDRFVEKTPLHDDLTLIHFTVHERTLYVAKSG